MLITFLIWLVAGSAALGYGLIAFRTESPGTPLTRLEPESFAVRLYLGFLLISSALLAIALLTNVSWWLGLALAVPGIVIAAAQFSRAHPRSTLRGPIASAWIYSGIGLLILAFFVSTADVQFFDTGLYHQQMAKWLSDYGLVPGVALIHLCLGLTSSWFAGAATLNHGPLRGREAAIIGGLPFALMTISSAAVAWRYRLAGILPGVRGLTWSLFCGMLLVVSIRWSIESSLSPDIMIWLLPGVVALVLTDPSTKKSDSVGLALLISSLVFTVKLSAAPLIAYCGLLWLWQFFRDRRARKALLVYLGLALAAILVLAAANIRTSGCPLYPSPIGCTTGDSSVGSDFAARLVKGVSDFAVQGNRYIAWFVIVALAGTVFALKRLWKDPFVFHGLAASWCGSVFILITAPNPRFGMGYLLLPVAMSLAILVQSIHRKWPTVPAAGRWLLPWVTAVAALIFLGLSIRRADSPLSLLLPNRIASAEGDPIHIVNQKLNTRTRLSLIHFKLGDVLVVSPRSSDQCWDAALPCAGEIRQSVELKEPAQGFRGGFRRSSSRLQPGDSAVGH